MEGTPACKQCGEGKESNGLANGADDFLNAGRGVLESSYVGGPWADVQWDLLSLPTSYCPGEKGSGRREGPSDCESLWNFDNEGDRVLGSSAFFFWIALVRIAITQTTALHQEANHRKEKPEQAEKIEVPQSVD